jgi:hypothetical protein
MITSISRNIEQLNLPLSPLTTSHGMSSEIIGFVRTHNQPNPAISASTASSADATRSVRAEEPEPTTSFVYAGWLRKNNATGEIIYAGFYTTCLPPAYRGRCVKVVFPLPHGSATVILKPLNGPDGSLKLVSKGRRFGGPGYYRIHRVNSRRLRVKHVPIEETIHVYFAKDKGTVPAQSGVLHTVHHFKFWGLKFLTLHYRMAHKQAQPPESPFVRQTGSANVS